MNKKKHIRRIEAILKRTAHAPYLITGVVSLFVLLAGVYYYWPQSVQFSYAEETCFPQLTSHPASYQTDSSEFTVTYEDTWTVGDVSLLATKTCVTPVLSPQQGTYEVARAPFGGFIGRTGIAVTVPEAPMARSAELSGQTISTAKPLQLELTSEDVVHSYDLKIADKEANCDALGAIVSCNLADLGLAQGAEYTAGLYRSFKGESEQIVAAGTVATLQPLHLLEATLNAQDVIYDLRSDATFMFDKTVAEVAVSLKTEDTEIPVTTEIDGTHVKVLFSEALPRQAAFVLEFSQVTGDNGSSLEAPLQIPFTTSGGPQVAQVSIGKTSIATNAAITVTFDQPFTDDVDVASYARIEGVASSVQRLSNTQIRINLANAPGCTDFTVVVEKGLVGALNNETTTEAWRYGSRTICGYGTTIGYSVQGRAIPAYYFGSGGTTILFTGGIHGSEPSSVSTMWAWVYYLQAYGNIIPADKRVVIVPNANPDGGATGNRYNANNVNLGRNFPTANWKSEIQTYNGSLPGGGGLSAGSEPEAQALINLTRQLRPRLEVSFHAQGSLVGANKYADSVAIGDVYASTTGYRTMYYNAEAVMGYEMTGEYEDWMGEEMGIPAILIELPTTSGNYLNSQLPALKKMLTL